MTETEISSLNSEMSIHVLSIHVMSIPGPAINGGGAGGPWSPNFQQTKKIKI